MSPSVLVKVAIYQFPFWYVFHSLVSLSVLHLLTFWTATWFKANVAALTWCPTWVTVLQPAHTKMDNIHLNTMDLETCYTPSQG